MSGTLPVGVRSTKVALVSDGEYYVTLRGLIAQASTCCYASVFIVDLNAHHDPDARVLRLLQALQGAGWRGVDVRLLIGGSQSNLAIDEASHIARHVALSLGIDCRLLSGDEDRRGSHAKVVTVDDIVLSGSHNWSSGAFSGQVQDSLLVESRPLAAYMRAAFEEQWSRAGAGE